MIDKAWPQTALPLAVNRTTWRTACGADASANARADAIRAACARMLKVTIQDWERTQSLRKA